MCFFYVFSKHFGIIYSNESARYIFLYQLSCRMWVNDTLLVQKYGICENETKYRMKYILATVYLNTNKTTKEIKDVEHVQLGVSMSY